MGNIICTLKQPAVLEDKSQTTTQTLGLQQEKPPKPAAFILCGSLLEVTQSAVNTALTRTHPWLAHGTCGIGCMGIS